MQNNRLHITDVYLLDQALRNVEYLITEGELTSKFDDKFIAKVLLAKSREEMYSKAIVHKLLAFKHSIEYLQETFGCQGNKIAYVSRELIN